MPYLKFNIDRAELMRAGLNSEERTVIIGVDPSGLTPEQRALLADRMADEDCLIDEDDGAIPVCQGFINDDGKLKPCVIWSDDPTAELISAKAGTVEALLEACAADQAECDRCAKRLAERSAAKSAA